MSDGINRVFLLGKLGAEPELRTTQGGLSVLNLRLATNESWLDKNKQQQERVEWHDVVIWGNRAEALAKLLSKGDGLMIEGGLRTSSYEKDGVKRFKTEVHAREVCFAGKARGAALPTQEESLGEMSTSRRRASRADVIEADLPF